MPERREERKGPTFYSNWSQEWQRADVPHAMRFVMALGIIMAVLSVGGLFIGVAIEAWAAHGMRAVIAVGSVIIALVVLWRATAGTADA